VSYVTRIFYKALARMRIAEGWSPWWGPDRKLVWARPIWAGKQLHYVQTEPLCPDELEVLDEVLREKVS